MDEGGSAGTRVPESVSGALSGTNPLHTLVYNSFVDIQLYTHLFFGASLVVLLCSTGNVTRQENARDD